MKLVHNHLGIQMHEQQYRTITVRYLTVPTPDGKTCVFMQQPDTDTWGFVSQRDTTPALAVLAVHRETVAKVEGRGA